MVGKEETSLVVAIAAYMHSENKGQAYSRAVFHHRNAHALDGRTGTRCALGCGTANHLGQDGASRTCDEGRGANGDGVQHRSPVVRDGQGISGTDNG